MVLLSGGRIWQKINVKLKLIDMVDKKKKKKPFLKLNGLFSMKAMKIITGRIATETRQILLKFSFLTYVGVGKQTKF